MPPARRERISGVDTAWLRMEQPTNLMMIVGVWRFEDRLELKAVKRAIENRFLAYHRFRQYAVQDATGAWWEDDEKFDIDSHVHLTALPGKADKAELQALVSDLASSSLDFSKPLWQFHVVDNYRGGSALIMRIHHCYADGIALTEVVLSMTDETAAGSRAIKHEVIETSGSADADFWAQILKPLSGALEQASRVGRSLIEQGRELATHPQIASEAIEEVARKGMDFAGEIARIALMGRDADTRFKGPLGVRKIVAWAEPLPLEEVKVMGKALGCSINDVLLAMASGALRDYLEEAGDRVDGLEIRAIVPVNLRPLGEARKLGNHFGLVFLDLPVGVEDPMERLHEVRFRMHALKDSYQPVIALGLLHTVGYGPKILQEQVTSILSQNATAVMTNVPGPQHSLYFAGRRIAELNFWVPQSGGIGMGVSILSYNGQIQFGLMTDEALVPNPDRIVARFHDEYEKLMWLTLMNPWGEEMDGRPHQAIRKGTPPSVSRKAGSRSRSNARLRGSRQAGKVPMRRRKT